MEDALPMEMRLLLQSQGGNNNPKASVPSAQTESSTSVDLAASSVKAPARKRLRKTISDEAVDVTAVVESPQTPAAPPSEAVEPAGVDRAKLWTLNWEQYTRYKRHEMCVRLVKERMGNVAALIAKIILEQSIKYERSTHIPAPRLSPRSKTALYRHSERAFSKHEHHPSVQRLQSHFQCHGSGDGNAVRLVGGLHH